MAQNRRMLDLCSGYGGASEAFLRAGWDIVRIEINTDFANVPGTVIQDILDDSFEYWDELPFDFIWSSPPCLEFSAAYNAPREKAKRENIEFEPDKRIIKKSLEIIEHFKPKYWVIENVQGAKNDISEIVGKPPRQIVGPFYFWGQFPFICMEPGYKHTKASEDKRWHPLRANIKAKIPLEISEAFLREFNEQPSLKRWY